MSDVVTTEVDIAQLVREHEDLEEEELEYEFSNGRQFMRPARSEGRGVYDE